MLDPIRKEFYVPNTPLKVRLGGVAELSRPHLVVQISGFKNPNIAMCFYCGDETRDPRYAQAVEYLFRRIKAEIEKSGLLRKTERTDLLDYDREVVVRERIDLDREHLRIQYPNDGKIFQRDQGNAEKLAQRLEKFIASLVANPDLAAIIQHDAKLEVPPVDDSPQGKKYMQLLAPKLGLRENEKPEDFVIAKNSGSRRSV